MPSKYRAYHLTNWGFNCTCSLCTAPEDERKRSDRRRERVVDILYAMNDEALHYNDFVGLAEELIRVVEQERLTRQFSTYYHTLMKLYSEYSDMASSEKYARRALEYAEAFDDPEGEFVLSLRRNIETLETSKRME
jgi:hypothetical protein